MQQAHGVSRKRVAKAWKELLRNRRATHHRSSFDHLDREASHAEVGCASQPIVTRADDDDVIFPHRAASSYPDQILPKHILITCLRNCYRRATFGSVEPKLVWACSPASRSRRANSSSATAAASSPPRPPTGSTRGTCSR